MPRGRASSRRGIMAPLTRLPTYDGAIGENARDRERMTRYNDYARFARERKRETRRNGEDSTPAVFSPNQRERSPPFLLPLVYSYASYERNVIRNRDINFVTGAHPCENHDRATPLPTPRVPNCYDSPARVSPGNRLVRSCSTPTKGARRLCRHGPSIPAPFVRQHHRGGGGKRVQGCSRSRQSVCELETEPLRVKQIEREDPLRSARR